MSINQTILATVFGVCLALVAYAYLIYPALILCLSRCFGRRGEAPGDAHAELPTVTLLIAAYNEEAVIGDRLDNALALDYPEDKLEIVVASDGSSDDTAEIVHCFAGQGVRLLDYARRRGKAAVLNAAVGELKNDIVIFSDANTFMDPDAVCQLVRWFHEARLGVVCGRLVLSDASTGRNVDGMYWSYETFLKQCEGRLGALLGANGAIYAIRRKCYTPIPDDTIVDDLVIPLMARLRTGCAIVYDCDAVAREETAPDMRAEFRRRSRLGAGGFQSLGMLWPLLHPRQGWVAFTFTSHKVLRWLCPFFLLGMLVSNVLLWEAPVFQCILLGQAGFYLVSVLAPWLPAPVRVFKLLRLTSMFTGMNLALLVGFWRWLRGSQKAAWQRTARLAEASRFTATEKVWQ